METKGAGAVGTHPRQRKVQVHLPERMPVPVRALWETASVEAKGRAQTVATVLLEIWLGRMSRAEGAKRLGLTPVRLWQLSQQATSGMVAGLLKQPRARKRALAGMASEEPMALRKRILALERETRVQRELIGILRSLPGTKAELEPARAPARKKKEGALGGSRATRALAQGAPPTRAPRHRLVVRGERADGAELGASRGAEGSGAAAAPAHGVAARAAPGAT